jgi:sugar/nucleoside kinase (ribokinase family)
MGDFSSDIAFGQADNLVERGVLTVGGSSTIMACGAARLGLRVAFAGVFGDDTAGHFMLDQLAERGVDVSPSVVLPGRTTAICVHLVKRGAERDRAMISWRGCDGELEAGLVRPALRLGARHLHVGSFYLLPKLAPDLANLFAEAREAGCTTSLDPQGDPERRWQGGLRETLRQTGFFLPNRSGGLAVAKSLGRVSSEAPELTEVLRSLAALGPVTVIKSAAEGGIALDGDEVIRVASQKVRPVDTIGAGDSFDAGFVYGHLQGWTVAQSLSFAVACGTTSTRAAGGVDGQATVEEALAMSAENDVLRLAI